MLSKTLLWIDTSKRDIPRSQNYERQKYEYSGKKKGHKIKNHILCDHEGYVLYLSPTYAGSIHDKTMAEESEFEFPEGWSLPEELGYLGFNPENIKVFRPFKKPKKGKLSEGQKI